MREETPEGVPSLLLAENILPSAFEGFHFASTNDAHSRTSSRSFALFRAFRAPWTVEADMARRDGVRWDGKRRSWWSTVRREGDVGGTRVVWLEKHEDRRGAEAHTKRATLALRAPCQTCGRKEGRALVEALGTRKRKRKERSDEEGQARKEEDRQAWNNANRQTRAIATAMRELAAQRTLDASRDDLLETHESKTLLLAALVAEEWAKELLLRQVGDG